MRPRPVPSHTYPVIPEKSKQTDDATKESDSDAETVLYEAPVSGNDEPAPEPDISTAPNKKGKFLTQTFGVKKPTESTTPKRQHRYKCSGPSCKEIFDNMSSLNHHFKASHEPVNCTKCGLHFNTPSMLACHMYLHRELKYQCH